MHRMTSGSRTSSTQTAASCCNAWAEIERSHTQTSLKAFTRHVQIKECTSPLPPSPEHIATVPLTPEHIATSPEHIAAVPPHTLPKTTRQSSNPIGATCQRREAAPCRAPAPRHSSQPALYVALRLVPERAPADSLQESQQEILFADEERRSSAHQRKGWHVQPACRVGDNCIREGIAMHCQPARSIDAAVREACDDKPRKVGTHSPALLSASSALFSASAASAAACPALCSHIPPLPLDRLTASASLSPRSASLSLRTALHSDWAA